MSTVRLLKLKDWKLLCPKCAHIEASQEGGEKSCGNCGASTQAIFGSAGKWESEDARKSWRRVACSQDCGWYVTSVNCSQCGTKIEGDFIQGNRGCFVATACFDDIDHPTVRHLRIFRDLHLSSYRLGQMFIEWYYKNGPSYARWVSDKPRIKAYLRIMLNQLVKILPK